MSYEDALKAAGADVHDIKYFGSYQGDWWAHVTLGNQTGFIHGYFGSCSHCDGFEAEFGWDDQDHCDQHFDRDPECKGCSAANDKYQSKLRSFGQSYVDGIVTKDAAIAEAEKDADWDSEAANVIDWLKSH